MRALINKAVSRALLPIFLTGYIESSNVRASEFEKRNYTLDSTFNYVFSKQKRLDREANDRYLFMEKDFINKDSFQQLNMLEAILYEYKPSANVVEVDSKSWISRHKVASSFIFGALGVVAYLVLSREDKDKQNKTDDKDPGSIGGGDEF